MAASAITSILTELGFTGPMSWTEFLKHVRDQANSFYKDRNEEDKWEAQIEDGPNSHAAVKRAVTVTSVSLELETGFTITVQDGETSRTFHATTAREGHPIREDTTEHHGASAVVAYKGSIANPTRIHIDIRWLTEKDAAGTKFIRRLDTQYPKG
jgi:hypothetical protein